MRLTSGQRLRRRSEFAALRSGGWRRECGPFLMQARLRTEPGSTRRLGVIASRRMGNAVARNRAKRLMREVFRLGQDRIPGGSDLTLVARESIKQHDFGTLWPIFLENVERFRRWSEKRSEET